MNINNVEDIINLIARRDHLTYVEAWAAMDECMALIEDAIGRGDWEEAEDILREELSLEPDYLTIMVGEMF